MGGTNRHGAAEARRAHNPEDIRSKRIAGIFQFGSFKETARGTYVHLVGLSDIKQSGYGLVVRFNAHLKRDRDS